MNKVSHQLDAEDGVLADVPIESVLGKVRSLSAGTRRPSHVVAGEKKYRA
jgi:hypothetical protein